MALLAKLRRDLVLDRLDLALLIGARELGLLLRVLEQAVRLGTRVAQDARGANVRLSCHALRVVVRFLVDAGRVAVSLAEDLVGFALCLGSELLGLLLRGRKRARELRPQPRVRRAANLVELGFELLDSGAHCSDLAAGAGVLVAGLRKLGPQRPDDLVDLFAVVAAHSSVEVDVVECQGRLRVSQVARARRPRAHAVKSRRQARGAS